MLGSIIIIVFRIIRKRRIFHSFLVNSLTFGIFKTLKISPEDRKMKYALMINRYPAPINISHLPFAIEYPQVHSGGIRAVAIATPGITLLTLSSLVCPIIPASPPKKAMRTSKKSVRFLLSVQWLAL